MRKIFRDIALIATTTGFIIPAGIVYVANLSTTDSNSIGAYSKYSQQNSITTQKGGPLLNLRSVGKRGFKAAFNQVGLPLAWICLIIYYYRGVYPVAQLLKGKLPNKKLPK